MFKHRRQPVTWTNEEHVLWWVASVGDYDNRPDSKVHVANIGPIWGRQDPGGPHVGPMNFAIWAVPSCVVPTHMDPVMATRNNECNIHVKASSYNEVMVNALSAPTLPLKWVSVCVSWTMEIGSCFMIHFPKDFNLVYIIFQPAFGVNFSWLIIATLCCSLIPMLSNISAFVNTSWSTFYQ